MKNRHGFLIGILILSWFAFGCNILRPDDRIVVQPGAGGGGDDLDEDISEEEMINAPTPTVSKVTSVVEHLPTTPPPLATPIGEEPTLSSPGPSPTPAADNAQIDSFTADHMIANPGDTIRLSWQTTGVFSVDLRMFSANGSSALIGTGFDANSWIDVDIAEHERNHVSYILTANYGGDPLTQELVVELTCPVTWFFDVPPPPDLCPLWSAEATTGQLQLFEHGLMILNQATGFVHVMYEDTFEFSRDYDTWRADMPDVDPDLAPPDGLYSPVRGFGIIWKQNSPGTESTVGERLGWATGPVIDIQTAYQCAAVNEPATSNPCFVMGKDSTVYLEVNGKWRIWNGELDTE
jgi:hypothetical protein